MRGRVEEMRLMGIANGGGEFTTCDQPGPPNDGWIVNV